MNDERSTVVAVFENRDQVRCAEEALRNAGFSQDDYGYDREFEAGRIIMTTRAHSRYQEAYDILHRCGAYDMHAQGAGAYNETATGTMRRDERMRLHDEETRMNYEGDPNVPETYDNTDDRDVGEGI